LLLFCPFFLTLFSQFSFFSPIDLSSSPSSSCSSCSSFSCSSCSSFSFLLSLFFRCSYIQQDVFDLSSITPDAWRMFEAARRVTPHVAMFLPRNVNLDQVCFFL
jgi:hypothetical protein